MFHNQWYVVLAERDADGNPILDKSNNPTGNTKTILPFLDGSETYETLEDGRYVTKQIFPFMLPDASGDNKSWNTTSTQTLTDGENLMVYASDVAAINLEVADEAVNNESPVLLTISDSEGMIFAAPVTQKVYTIPYDFSTTLTAELIQNDTVQQYVINAGDLVHTVMNYDGNYYYMTGSGIRSSAWPEEDAAALNAIADQAADETSESSQDQEQTMIQGLCEGQFLNMWAGKALDINGDIWDLETRTIEENAQIDRDAMAAKAEAVMNASVATLSADGTEDGVSSTQSVIEAMSQLADTESQPLYQFRYGDTTLEVYGKDTISIKNGQSNSLDSLVYVKNGHLYPVDSELDTVTGAVLADAYGDKRYLSVLTSDGSIEDLGNDLTLPSKFKNSSIVELADNLESDSRVAIGRYKNGTAFAFDYITGKVITLYEDEYDTGNDENILDYAKDWIVSKTGSWFGINNSGYRGAQDMINQYQEGGSDGILGQLRQIERTVTTWKDGADTSGSADTKDGSASGTDNLDGSDNASGEGSSDLNNDSAVSTKGSSEDHTDQTGSGTELKDAEAEDKTSVKNASKDTDAHGKHTGDADAEAAGDKKAAGDKAEAQATDKNVDKTVQSAAVNDGAAQAENPADGSDKVQESEVSLGTSDGQKADAKTHDEQTSGELEGAADSENAGNEENADAAEAGQTAEDAGQNAAAENAADGQEDGSDVSGDQEAAQTTDAAGNGQTSAAGSQAAEGSQIAEGAENAEAGQTGEAAENVLAAAEAADAQTSAKAKDQLVSIYNADTKSYEVYDVEDFLSAPKDEIITVSEKVTELTKQGLINNATDLKAEDNKINDTNRYGILIYCGIAATILLLLGYLFNRKWKDWK